MTVVGVGVGVDIVTVTSQSSEVKVLDRGRAKREQGDKVSERERCLARIQFILMCLLVLSRQLSSSSQTAFYIEDTNCAIFHFQFKPFYLRCSRSLTNTWQAPIHDVTLKDADE